MYRKVPTLTLALRLDRGLAAPVGWQADPLQGHRGDWLLRYADGSHGVVQDSVFQESYQPAPPD